MQSVSVGCIRKNTVTSETIHLFKGAIPGCKQLLEENMANKIWTLDNHNEQPVLAATSSTVSMNPVTATWTRLSSHAAPNAYFGDVLLQIGMEKLKTIEHELVPNSKRKLQEFVQQLLHKQAAAAGGGYGGR